MRILFLSALLLFLSGCLATPRFTSTEVDDYEPPSRQKQQTQQHKKPVSNPLKISP
jgi:hypothetical protein